MYQGTKHKQRWKDFQRWKDSFTFVYICVTNPRHASSSAYICVTNVRFILHLFYICIHFLAHLCYICLHLYTIVYICATFVYNCIQLFTCVLQLFTIVYNCLHVLVHVLCKSAYTCCRTFTCFVTSSIRAFGHALHISLVVLISKACSKAYREPEVLTHVCLHGRVYVKRGRVLLSESPENQREE